VRAPIISTIARELTPDQMHAIALYYGGPGRTR
jgi:hypothetical protein